MSYLGFTGYELQIGSDDRILSLWPDDPERAELELRLDFHPLAIHGDLDDRAWVCGVDANGHGTIRGYRIEPNSPSWLETEWTFTSPEPSYFTGVVYDPGAPGGQLFLFDGLGSKLYSLRPNEPELTLVACGERHPELLGMQLLMLAGSEDELWLTLADVKDPGDIAADTVLTLLIDRDGDHRLDEIRQELAGAE